MAPNEVNDHPLGSSSNGNKVEFTGSYLIKNGWCVLRRLGIS